MIVYNKERLEIFEKFENKLISQEECDYLLEHAEMIDESASTLDEIFELYESGELSDEEFSFILEDASGVSDYEKKDILYNKKKFDSGEINLCFVTGFSGSGKSSLSRGIKASMVDMDRIIMYSNKPDSFFASDPKVVQEYWKGPGKKYRLSIEERNKYGLMKFDKDVTNSVLEFVQSYASAHKNEKFIMDGVWIFLFIEPSRLKNYAVYLKGTSALTSTYRKIKRGSSSNTQKKQTKLTKALYVLRSVGGAFVNIFDGRMRKYWKFYRPLYEQQLKESENGGKK